MIAAEMTIDSISAVSRHGDSPHAATMTRPDDHVHVQLQQQANLLSAQRTPRCAHKSTSPFAHKPWVCVGV
jgi:hypothetical protein